MISKKEILIILSLIVIPIFFYYFYTKLSNYDNINKKWNNIFLLEFENCKNAPEYIQDLLDNLSDLFNGIFYDKPFSLCILYEKIYCLNSKVFITENISFVYFDTICISQETFSKEEIFIIFDYNISKRITNLQDILIAYKNKKVFTNDKNLIKILEKT